MPFGLDMPSFPALKKWQLLLFVLTACIILMMVLTVFSSIWNPSPSGVLTMPYGTYWYDSCEDLTHFNFNSSGYNLTYYINNVSYRQPTGSLDLDYPHFSGYGGASITNDSMIPPVLPTIAFENTSDCPELVYAAWGRIVHWNYTYCGPTYFVYWLASGGHHFEFYPKVTTGTFWFGGVFPDYYAYEDTHVTVDTNWHWFAVRVINITSTGWVSGHKADYHFYIDGARIMPAYPSGFISDDQAIFPTTFLTINYGDSSFYAHWGIDYLRTSAYVEYPPQYPYLVIPPVDIVTGEMIMMAIGLIGAMIDIVTPVYSVETFIDGDYVSALGFGFMGMLLGTAFIVAWLW